MTPERIIAACACILITLGCPPPGEGRAREPLPGVFIEARDLTRAEMTEVRRLAGTTGRAPWLIYGFRFGPGPKSAPRRTRIEIYLQPDVENSRLRRGRVLHAEFSPAGGGRTVSARLESTSRYAHVVVLGRAPDEVRGKWDPHRPFIVDGDFDDETLFRLVALVRRSPEGPRLPSGEPGARIDGSLAISHVRRVDAGVEVTLNREDYQGETVTVEERQGKFVIVKHVIWIV